MSDYFTLEQIKCGSNLTWVSSQKVQHVTATQMYKTGLTGHQGNTKKTPEYIYHSQAMTCLYHPSTCTSF